MAQETGVQSKVESYQRLKKWYLIPPCLTLSIIRYGSRVKWINPGKGVATSSTPQCSSSWKGSILVSLDNNRKLYFYQSIGLMSRVFANSMGDWGSIPGWVIPNTQKMVLDTALLSTQHYKVRLQGKMKQSRERSRALPYTLV